MADADRIAAALRYQQELDAAQRPATMNPNIAAQGLKSRNRIAATLASQPQSWSGEALPMEGRAAFLPFQDTMPGSVMNTRSLALPGIVAGAVNAITAPGRALVDPEFNQGEEAANVALNMMGGGMSASRAVPAGSLGMNVTSRGRIPESGVDTRKLADMLERAGNKGGYQISREGSAVSPSQYITFDKVAGESNPRQIRISNHADKYPELATGIRTSVDPASEISFEQAVNWLAKEGYPTNLSNKYKNIPSWEQHYAQQQAARDENRLEILISAWRNKPKATRGPMPTQSDRPVKENGSLGMNAIKKGSQEIMPTEHKSAMSIEPPHNVRDTEKLSSLTKSMKNNGWQGRPILTYDVGRGNEALTGSHRIKAANQAGIEVPIYKIQNAGDYIDKNGKSIQDIGYMELKEQIKWLEKFGDKDAAKLLKQEPEF